MTDQLTHADLKGMTPEGIEEARVTGRLATLLGAPPQEVELLDRAADAFLTAQDIHGLAALGRHDLIETARAAGRINYTESEN